MKNNVFLSFCFTVSMLAFSGLGAAAETPGAAVPVFLRTVDFSVKGISREFALKNAAEIKGNERFADKAAFDAWIEERKQLLINQRVMESAEIDVSFGEKTADGAVPADIVIRVVDTWNIIALPKPQYDSNDGLEIIIKARDYNFLGTMQALRFDLGYEIEPEPLEAGDFSKGSFIFEIDSNVPFRLHERDWKFDFDHQFSYVYGEPLEYANQTGVSLIVPFRDTEFTFGAYQGIYVNEENDDADKAEYGDRFADVWFLASWLSSSWEIPTGLTAGKYGDVSYTPRAILKQKYRPFGDIGDPRAGPTLELGHKLSFDRIDWKGNFRSGLGVALDNENTYNFFHQSWERKVKLTSVGHFPIFGFAGASLRMTAAWYPDDDNDSAATFLRGILDDSVDADYGVFVNTELPVRVIQFLPSKWFKTSKLRFFDFEQHWSPFIDFAFLANEETDRAFSLTDPEVSGGLELVTFPLFMRSLYIRISVGFDLREALATRSLPDGDGREIFIGIGHHY